MFPRQRLAWFVAKLGIFHDRRSFRYDRRKRKKKTSLRIQVELATEWSVRKKFGKRAHQIQSKEGSMRTGGVDARFRP